MKKTLSVLAVAAVLGATPAHAGNGTRAIGFGPIQDSMGGASVGAPLEATAMATNPAGLAGMKRGIDVIISYDDQMASWDAEGASGPASTSARGLPWFPMPNVGLVWPVAESLTLGIATVCGGPFGVSQVFHPASTRTSTWNRRITPAAAYRITKDLALGVSANIMWDGINYEAPGGTSLPRDNQTAWGYGATIGLSYTPIESLSLGVAYESKGFFPDFEWKIPSHQVLDPSTGTMVTVPGGVEKLDFDLPQVATVGASVRPTESLLLAADLEWINWSDTRGKNKPAIDTDPTLTGAHLWSMNWSDQMVVKLGVQYALTTALKIRAGYNYGKTPLDASRAFENIDFPALAQHHITLGAGFSSGRLTVNAAGMYVPEAKLSGSNAAQGISSYEIKMSQIAFELGMAYRF
jgi:long-chain fatty acid transport protein